jgi:branched-chain amino acid transport system substrate-binding protein
MNSHYLSETLNLSIRPSWKKAGVTTRAAAIGVALAIGGAGSAWADMEAAPTVQSLTNCPNITTVKTAKIGILAALTGSLAADTGDLVNAAKMAAEDLAAAGGVCGPGARYKFEFVEADTEGMRNDAVVTAFRRLNGEEGLNFIMTPYASTSNFEEKLMAQANMVYLISANSAQTRDIISPNPDAFPTVWSRVPSYDAYQTDLPPLLEKFMAAGTLKLTDKTVYVIGSDDPDGTTIADGLTDNFIKHGWKIVGKEKVPFQSVTDWHTQIAKIHEANPSVVVNTEWTPGGAATFFNQFIEQPTNSVVFLQYAPSIPEFDKLVHNKATGVIYNMLGGAIDSRPDTKAIVAAYDKRYGPGGYFSVAGYSDVMLYALCINKGNDPTDRLAIGKCIGSIDVDTPAGRMKFDQKTHLTIHGDDYFPTAFYEVGENGKNMVISPEKFADQPFKMPYWMQ